MYHHASRASVLEKNVTTPAPAEDELQKPDTTQVIIISVFSGLTGFILGILSARQLHRIKTKQLTPGVSAQVVVP